MGKRTWGKVDWKKASDIEKRIKILSKLIGMDWVNTERIYCVRSTNSSSRAYARIWGLSRIWQETLKIKPAYIIEVLSNRFDGLPEEKQNDILIHELAHIPKNFSGSLVPHIRKKGKRNFNDRVKKYIKLNKIT